MGRRPFGKRRFHRKRNFIRKNEGIRVPEIRVIGADGKMIGVMPPAKALKIAKEHFLDLVEVSASARPPVCRILDFGKYKYEQSKLKKNKDKSKSSKVKEVKFRVRIDVHDYETKLKRAEQFLMHENKVKITLMFRGREMEHKNLGFDRVNQAVEDLKTMAIADSPPRLVGRHISVLLSPLPKSRRNPRYNLPNEIPELEELEDEDGLEEQEVEEELEIEEEGDGEEGDDSVEDSDKASPDQD
ncbi:MAG: translation initiation factor IF-3 [Opitutae bacterium]|nr:translation initiation factor IF-3 [Opitutae bacterium]|tara:strand:- start:424 stop:1152 length:729 start_codon:yes stop_codon:yes gene_type:complete